MAMDRIAQLRYARRMVNAALLLNGFDTDKVDEFTISRKLLDISGSAGESITDSLTYEFLCVQVAEQFRDAANDGTYLTGCFCRSCKNAREVVRERLAKSTRAERAQSILSKLDAATADAMLRHPAGKNR